MIYNLDGSTNYIVYIFIKGHMQRKIRSSVFFTIVKYTLKKNTHKNLKSIRSLV